jgi:signal transduction histidine kinase
MWYRRGDGTHTTFLVNAAPVRDNAGDIVRAVSTFHDVSDLKRAQEALRELNETLEARVEERTRQVRELSRALTLAEQQERQRIAYILHDDLQQVLFAAKLAGAAGDAEQFERVIDQAIDLTRSLSHELSPPLLKDEDLSGLLEWVADKKMERYGLEVEVDVGHGTSLPDADLRILFYQLVRELLFNVAKHAQTDRARVVAERAGVFVRVRIEDEGVGFDPAVLEEARSVGLGLASVRERLELVGGRLDVESAPGRGTRITMEVPLHAAKDAGTAASRS